MAFDEEELKKRRQKREALRKKREQEQKRIFGGLIAAGVMLVLCAVIIFAVARGTGTPAQPENDTLQTSEPLITTEPEQTTEPVQTTQPSETETPETEAPLPAKTVIHLAAAGDLNVTDKSVDSGTVVGSYDYTDVFMDVAPILADADITVLNFEGNFVGAPYGTDTVSAPVQMAQALKAAGVDLLQMANSCTVNNGLIGLDQTLGSIRAAGMESVGAFATPEEFRRTGGYTIREVEGIRIAFVAFTKGVGSLGLPAGSEDCVNLLYTDYASTYQNVDRAGINKLLQAVADEEPDITVALLHWGSEFNDQISSTQETITKLMWNNGVDVIIGTHPHYVQKMEFDEENGRFLAYSLGDFFGDAEKAGSNYSVILDLEITRDNETGETKVTGFDYTPIYTVSNPEDGAMRVVRIANAMEAVENNRIDQVTKGTYESMEYALTRIQARIAGE